MNGSFAVLVATLLTLAAVPIGGVPTGPPEPVAASSDAGATAAVPAVDPIRSQQNWSNYLGLAGPTERTGFQTVTLDVSGTLSGDSTSLHGQYSASRVTAAFESAQTPADRHAALATSANRIESRIAALEARQRAALAAYNSGEITARQFLRELAAVDRGARALELATSRLDSYNGELNRPAVSTDRIASLKARLVSIQGPVRSQVAQAMAEGEPVRVFVETSNEGIVLSTIVRGDRSRYVREAYVPEHRDPEGTDQWEGDLGKAFDRFPELYPWTWAHKQSLDIPQTSLSRIGVYPITVTYPTGSPRNTLTTYFDGATGTPFRESQQQDLQSVRYRDPVVNGSGGLVIQVNRTHAGGPLEVLVRDSSSGEPVDATLTVDNETIGSTGPDGHRYALTPAASFTVTAVYEGRSVSVTAEPAGDS